MSELALIGLGSNLGDRSAAIDRAVAAIAATPGVRLIARASDHATEPVGGPEGQGPFLNSAVRVETDLSPDALLGRLRAIEADAGRVRDVRWGERTLDLDLLIHGSTRLESADLTLPHPRMAVRRFVLAPLAEIAPEAVEPVSGLTIRELLANLDRRPGRLAIQGPPGRYVESLHRRLEDRLGPEGWAVDVGGETGGRMGEPTFVVVLAGPSTPGVASLRVESTGPDDVVAEVVAACVASRAGASACPLP